MKEKQDGLDCGAGIETPHPNDCNETICESCHGRAVCVQATLSIEEFTEIEWRRYQRGWLQIDPEDMRTVRFLCEDCARI